MKGKRTGIDFSKHQVIETKSEGLLIHYLRRPDTIINAIKYINCEGIMAVTGDFGNWIFCREFHPAPDGGVSEGYWHEKLQIASTQHGMEYDPDRTRKNLQHQLDVALKEDYKGNDFEVMKEYIEGCLSLVDEEDDYKLFAYTEYPGFCDYEVVIFCKRYKPWLLAVFDGFDEICRRLKEKEVANEQ